MNIRLYVRSICRTFSNQWMFFNDAKNLFEDTLQIFGKKKEMNQAVIFNKEKLERKRELINLESSLLQSKNINFMR